MHTTHQCLTRVPVKAHEVPETTREAAARSLRDAKTSDPWRLIAMVNGDYGTRHAIYVKKVGASIRYAAEQRMPHVFKCYGDRQCEAPGIVVRLLYRDEPEYVRVKLCGPHAREAMRLGFRTEAVFGRMNIKGLLPEVDRYAERMPNLSSVSWTEVQEAPRTWCDNGCKIHAKRHENGVSVWLMHSRTYGCPVGV